MKVAIAAGIVAATCVGCGDSFHPADAAVARCHPMGRFEAPAPVGQFATADHYEADARFTPDELTVYLNSNGSSDPPRIIAASRPSLSEPFVPVYPLEPDINLAPSQSPSVTSDQLTLVFATFRGLHDGQRVYVATRSSTVDHFAGVTQVPLGSATCPYPPCYHDSGPYLSADGEELWFASGRDGEGRLGGSDIYLAAKDRSSFWPPSNVTALNSAMNDEFPVISADKLVVYLASNRAGSLDDSYDVWVSHRAAVGDAFSPPVPVTEVNSAMHDRPSWISTDNCRLYLTREGSDVYVATRTPI